MLTSGLGFCGGFVNVVSGCGETPQNNAGIWRTCLHAVRPTLKIQSERTIMKKRHSSRWIFLLLALLLVISLSLAWQAVDSVSSHQKTVNAVLQDYSELIIDDYVRSLRVKAGYEGLYRVATALGSSELTDADISNWEAERVAQVLEGIALPQDWLAASFRVTGNDTPSQWLYGTPDPQLAERLISRIDQSEDDRGPFLVFHLKQANKTGLQLAIRDKANQVLFVLMRPAVIGQIFASVFSTAPLLPSSFGNAAELRPHLQVLVTGPLDQTVFETGPQNDQSIGASRTMDARYAGLFDGYTASIHLNPSVAEVLAIGEPPWPSMVRTALLLMVALVLGSATFILIRRDRQLIELRSEFIARVSHELRTPLTQIRMFTESILLGRLPDREGETRALKIIDRETLRLSRLVENILSFSRSPGKPLLPEPEPYPLARLLDRLKDEFELQLEASGSSLNITCDPQFSVHLNRDALSQLLTNLLDNALKYGPEGQLVSITAELTDGQLEVCVQDEGPGIPTGEQQQIWQPYYRLERERDRGIAGTGIGLAVASELVDALNAEVSVHSDTHGSKFRLVFASAGNRHG